MSVSFVMLIIFLIAYLAIIFEHQININKSATALMTAVICWILISVWFFPDVNSSLTQLNAHLADISQILIFLIGAMTIVELINVYDGFRLISRFITTKDKRVLLWVISIITFFLSALLDNMTTSIVMVLLLRRFINNKQERFIFAGMVIIAANSGGAWSPIGDVTTTMLWISNRVSSGNLILETFFPSLVSMLVPLLFLSRLIPKEPMISEGILPDRKIPENGSRRVFILGISALIFVPILRELTGLPPYMGIIFGLGIMWMLTDQIHHQRHYLKVPHVLTKIDISSVLFFLGILLIVSALETVGLLGKLAQWMDIHINNKDIILGSLGIISSVVDNVPLTAAVMGMYDPGQFPMDSRIWEMSAYCLGTGGSLFIIGSAAGIVVMGMENIKFTTYFRKITLPAFAGYICGLLILWFY